MNWINVKSSLVFDSYEDATNKLQDHNGGCHHYRFICECGSNTTCRCSEPKTEVFIKSCPNCKE